MENVCLLYDTLRHRPCMWHHILYPMKLRSDLWTMHLPLGLRNHLVHHLKNFHITQSVTLPSQYQSR